MLLILPVWGCQTGGNEKSKLELTNPFFAFDNGTGRGELPLEDQAALVSEAGYAGIGYSGTQRIPEMLAALDAHDLEMFSIYVSAEVSQEGTTYDPLLPKAIKELEGRDTIIWLTVRGRVEDSEDSDDSDERAVAVVREIADLAAASNLRVALYPHVWFYVATVEDAVRVVEKVDRDNVGVSFNLCHWLKQNDEKNMAALIDRAKPHLYLVSINGADRGDTNNMEWDQLIQTLGRGSFDVYRFVRELKTQGYEGPIGLQCYKVPGDLEENLQRSMSAWQDFQSRMSQETLTRR